MFISTWLKLMIRNNQSKHYRLNQGDTTTSRAMQYYWLGQIRISATNNYARYVLYNAAFRILGVIL